MNSKRRLLMIDGAGIVISFFVELFVLRLTLVCCALPPTPPTLTAMATLLTRSAGLEAVNEKTVELLNQTNTATYQTALVLVRTATPISYPYEPTLYAQRLHEQELLKTAGGPTEYAIFFATETALVATYQGTVLTTSTPIPYTADMSPTALPPPTRATRTATPTLCPPSDVICPGGNATMSAAQEVMMLMASAQAPEFGQLAQTATALAVTPTPTPTSSVQSNSCAWSWAHRDLPDTAKAVQEALVSAGMTNVQIIRADAYGEECSNLPRDAHNFGAMSTDFYLSATLSNVDDADEAAQIITDAYNVLTHLKVELPADPGYLEITFTSGSETKHFRTLFEAIKQAIEAGKSGKELFTLGEW
jgi:hypothetical protein